jgi:hypothetical protein
MLVQDAVCESCGRSKGEKHIAVTSRPDMETLEEWVSDGIAEATDGCRVEPDGVCEHGHSSWLRVLGFI